MDDQFPTEWQNGIVQWAKNEPLIISIFLFGSRAKGCAQPSSDIDLAYQTRSDGEECPFTVAFFHHPKWKQELQALLPVKVDLQYADPAKDEVVWPAVLDHGIRLV